MRRYYRFSRFGRSRFAHLRIKEILYYASLISFSIGALFGVALLAAFDSFISYLLRAYS